jgi:hypothetical protein
MVYAFDFDGTLDDLKLQDLAVTLRRQKNEVWIVTMRRGNEFNKNKLKKCLDKLGLTEYNVIFCNEQPKWEYLNMINADVYIDNIADEFEIIKDHTKAVPLLWI